MSEVHAALLGALIGALAGLAGGGVASLASLRASQIAARAPLGQLLYEFGVSLVKLRGALDQPHEDRAKADVESKWNQFAVHQGILCPSERLRVLWEVLRFEIKRADLEADAAIHLAGQIQEKATRIVGAHSSHLFRWRALRSEAQIVASWLQAEQSSLLSSDSRARLEAMSPVRSRRVG